MSGMTKAEAAELRKLRNALRLTSRERTRLDHLEHLEHGLRLVATTRQALLRDQA